MDKISLQSLLKDKIQSSVNREMITTFLDKDPRVQSGTIASAWAQNIVKYDKAALRNNGWPVVMELMCIAKEVLQDATPSQ